VVDFRSDWALCSCHFAFAQIKYLRLMPCFRAELSGASGQQDVFCAKAKRQQQDVFCAKAQRQQQDIGHEGVITGRDAFGLRSSIADPQGVAQS